MHYGIEPVAELRVGFAGLAPKNLQIEKECDWLPSPGPLPGGAAVRGIAMEEIVLKPEQKFGSSGSIAFWLQSPTAILNGRDAPGGGQVFFTIPGFLKVNLWWYRGYCQFCFAFDGDEAPRHEMQLPGVPGPQWIHFCLAWDSEVGILQLYANGTPTRIPGVTIPPWPTNGGDTLLLQPSAWALGDIKIYDRPLNPDEAEALVPPSYRGALDSLIGAQPRGMMDCEDRKGALLYENALASKANLTGWRMEGPGLITLEDAWMEMASSEPDSEGPTGHIVHWCDQNFPADFVAEFEMQPRSEHGLVILFFSAKGVKGEDIFDPSLLPRNGIFGHYTGRDINSYHVSYYANTPGAGQGRGTSNLRKNSGFWLVDQGPIGIPPGSRAIHRITVFKDSNRIEVGVDGRRVIRWFDPADRYGPVHGSGKIGFRQMKWMKARYRNFRVFSLR